MYPRTLQPHLQEMAKVFPIIAVTGPRQSGKTTLSRAAFPNHNYINLETPDIRRAAIDDPRLFLKYYGRHGVIIDEAQKVPEIFSYLQEIVDEKKQMGEYILTGSHNFLLMENISQSLAGRVSIHHLLPFSINELPDACRQSQKLDQLLYTGMYPAIYDRNISPENYYPSYLQTYLERDVRSLKNIADLHLFQRFLRLCAGRVGQLLNLSAIGNELGIDAKTVRSWLSVLEASFIVFFLSPYHRNYNKRIVKHPKLYFHDTGLACALLGLTDTQQIANHYLRGALFENFIIGEFLKQQLHHGRWPDIFFWRDNTGNEIDLLIEGGNQLTAVEIKSGTTINESFFKNLIKFQKYAGVGPENCCLVYGGIDSLPRRHAQVHGWRDFLAPGNMPL